MMQISQKDSRHKAQKKAFIYQTAKTQSQMPYNQLQSVMQSELDELRDFEPYAHRQMRNLEKQQKHATSQLKQVKKSPDKLDKILNQQVDLVQNKLNMKMNAKQTEEWLNESLKMLSENETISALVPMKPSQLPLQVLNVDRLTLEKFGMRTESIDRIYKSLYVNSVGFFDTLRWSTATVEANKKHTVMGRFWKTYQYLMQYCCPTDFKMVSEKLMEDQMAAVEKVKAEFDKYKVDFDK